MTNKKNNKDQIPEKSDLQNRKIDKHDLSKTKSYLWRYIQETLIQNAYKKSSSFWRRLFTPAKLSFAGATAAILIFALFFTNNLNFIGLDENNITYANFEMTVDQETSLGIRENAKFTIKSSENMSAGEFKNLLEVSPELDFEIDKKGNGKYEIIPQSELRKNTVYKFRIKGTEELYSWAYQVQEGLKIQSMIPGDKSSRVPILTGIEIEFNTNDVDLQSFEDNFSISPQVKGRFEKVNNTLIFVPKEKLQEATIYTITLKKEVKTEKGEITLSEDKTIQFETEKVGEDDSQSDNDLDKEFRFTQDSYEISPNDELALRIYSNHKILYEGGTESEDTEKLTTDIEILKFKNESNFIAEMKRNDHSYHNWSEYNNSINGEANDSYIDNTKSLGVFTAEIHTANYRDYIIVPDFKLEKGLYLIKAANEDNSESTVLQVTNVSTYMNITETDSIFWVNSIETGDPIKGATISVLGGDEQHKTDKNGVSTFDIKNTLNKYDDYSSEATIKIEKNDDVLFKQLLIYSGERYINNKYWHFFDTDRAVYKPNDTINFFGFIQDKKGENKINKITVSLIQSSETIEKQIIEVNNDTYQGEFELKNMSPGYYSLQISTENGIISSKYFSIKNYTKPQSKIELNTDKQYYISGEKVVIDVSTQFFDGTLIPNQELKYSSYSDIEGTLTTDENAEAQIRYTANSSYIKSDYITVSSVNGEETEISSSVRVIIYPSEINLETNAVKKDNEISVNMQANWIDLDKMNLLEKSYYQPVNGGGVKNKEISAEIIKKTYTRYKNGSYYDYINKKTVDKYDYKTDIETIHTFTINTDENGSAQYNFTIPEFEKDKNSTVSYSVEAKIYDNKENLTVDSSYVYSDSQQSFHYFDNSARHSIQIQNGYQDEWKKRFKIGDEIETIVSSGYEENAAIIQDNEETDYLFLELNHGLIDYSLSEKPEYKTKFTEKSLPGLIISGVSFDGEHYKTIYNDTAYLKLDEKELNIEITADKEYYEPGEYVTLTVQTKDSENNAVSAMVNLNLIDEAYYKAIYDYIRDPLESIYSDVSSGSLQKETTHESAIENDDREGGKGGCFTAETQILLEDKTTKSIENIVIGDRILTKKDEFSSELVSAKVLNTYQHFVDGYLLINEELEVTPEHIMFINGAWKRADNMKVGDYLLAKNGDLIEVNKIEEIKESQYVYNFEVEELHTYFAGGYYVHNDKGGDGIRDDFEDNALFQNVNTDQNGMAEIKFQLPDNITSWRVTAKAIDPEKLQAGMSTSNIKVTMPMFVNIIANQEYSIKDSPQIKAQAFGNEVDLDSEITYKYKDSTEKSESKNPVYFNMEDLKLGENKLTVSAEYGEYKDAITKEIEVLESRLSNTTTNIYTNIKAQTAIQADKDSETIITFMSQNMALYNDELSELTYINGVRLDQELIRKIAKQLSNKHFGTNYNLENTYNQEYQNEDGGLSLLSYSSSDLELTVLYGLMTDDFESFDTYKLEKYFEKILDENQDSKNIPLEIIPLKDINLEDIDSKNKPSILENGIDLTMIDSDMEFEKILDENENIPLQDIDSKDKPSISEHDLAILDLEPETIISEDYILALAGLASLDKGVLQTLKNLDTKKLSNKSKLIVGLALAQLGDKNTSLEIYKSINNSELHNEEQALYPVLAAALKEKNAYKLWKNFEFEGIEKDLKSIYQIGYLKNMLFGTEEIKYDTKLKFTIQTEKGRETIELQAYQTHTVLLAQGEKVKILNTSGELAATATHTENIDAKDFPKDKRLSIERKYYLDGKETNTFKEGDLIKVEITATENTYIENNSYIVTDILPSGLRIVTQEYNNYAYNKNPQHPSKINKQEIKFYTWIAEDAYSENESLNNKNEKTFYYYARVVTPGTYHAEPAKIESTSNSDIATISEADEIVIKQ